MNEFSEFTSKTCDSPTGKVLWKAGKKIEDFDLLIGCAAKAKGLTIVTHNRRHFEHIEGLQIEDWAVMVSFSFKYFS